MALIKKIKVAVFECRPYEVPNNKDGQIYKGFTCKAWDEHGERIDFTSPTQVKENDLGGFDPAVAFDITLYGRDFQGVTKWSTDKKEYRPRNTYPSL